MDLNQHLPKPYDCSIVGLSEYIEPPFSLSGSTFKGGETMKFLYLLRAMVFFALTGAVILNSAEAVVALLIVAVALSAISQTFKFFMSRKRS